MIILLCKSFAFKSLKTALAISSKNISCVIVTIVLLFYSFVSAWVNNACASSSNLIASALKSYA